MQGTCCCTKWQWGHSAPMSSIGIEGTSVKNNFELASASLSAYLISLERRSSSCRVIRAGILANCANMLKPKGALIPWEGVFFNALSKRTSFCFSLSSARMMPGQVQWLPTLLDVVYSRRSGRTVTCTTCQTEYCLRGGGLTAKTRFSSSESLSEANVTTLSSIAMETTLQDLPLSLGWIDFHCSSLTIFGYTHMFPQTWLSTE